MDTNGHECGRRDEQPGLLCVAVLPSHSCPFVSIRVLIRGFYVGPSSCPSCDLRALRGYVPSFPDTRNALTKRCACRVVSGTRVGPAQRRTRAIALSRSQRWPTET